MDLLITARQDYDWPVGTGATASHATVIALEANVGDLMGASAHQIVVSVSKWAGNNTNSHANIVSATPDQQLAMQNSISLLTSNLTAIDGIKNLSALPGISLVIASKIYRFCVQSVGAAVDRHSSTSSTHYQSSVTDIKRIFAANGLIADTQPPT